MCGIRKAMEMNEVVLLKIIAVGLLQMVNGGVRMLCRFFECFVQDVCLHLGSPYESSSLHMEKQRYANLWVPFLFSVSFYLY
jgi:hypothetical protein